MSGGWHSFLKAMTEAVMSSCWKRCSHHQLQEIYGMDQAGSTAAKAELTEAEAEDRLCVICLVNERDTTVLPCRHMCMCHGALLAIGRNARLSGAEGTVLQLSLVQCTWQASCTSS
jgi:Zinc finger, C3HC4 type (RING finger)